MCDDFCGNKAVKVLGLTLLGTFPFLSRTYCSRLENNFPTLRFTLETEVCGDLTFFSNLWTVTLGTWKHWNLVSCRRFVDLRSAQMWEKEEGDGG